MADELARQSKATIHRGWEFSVAPFCVDYRASRLLLHVTSLPSDYGIGDLGPTAISWIDRTSESGQSWWQSLPLGPTGYGNSPYQPLSSFVGNALVISPDWLIEEELLTPNDAEHRSFSAACVEYDAVIPFKHLLLEKAWRHFKAGARADLGSAYEHFCQYQKHWLDDYALFRALKMKFDDAPYLEWPAELVERKPPALERVRRDLSDQIGMVCFVQFLVIRQAERLRSYAHAKDLRMIGDLPFFVSPDSSDVWANPELFLLDEQRRPRFVESPRDGSASGPSPPASANRLGRGSLSVAVFDTCDLVSLYDPSWSEPWVASAGIHLRLLLGFASPATVATDSTVRGKAFAEKIIAGEPLGDAWLHAVHDTAYAGADVAVAIGFGNDTSDAEWALHEMKLADLPCPRVPDLPAVTVKAVCH